MADSLKRRTWFVEAANIKGTSVEIRIFLVYAPLTFGHSQLIMKFSGKRRVDEATRFELAAPIVKKALVVLKKITGSNRLRSQRQFRQLTNLTRTEGRYIKTLILRTSASEKNNEYKIHLVPYFNSHARACKKRYTSIHSIYSNDTGGLLGWLGDRETIADSWQIKTDNPFRDHLDNLANIRFRLPKLATLLSQEWQAQA